MEQPLSIVELSPPADLSAGDYYYRTRLPFSTLLEQDGVDVVLSITSLDPRKSFLLEHADVVVLNNVCDPDVLPSLVRRRHRSLASVYEIQDDITAFQPWNPVFAFYQRPENRRLVSRTIAICGALQANNANLLARFGAGVPRTALLPNHLQALPELAPRAADRFVLGWGGSVGHLDDIRAVAPALIDWILAHHGTCLAVMAFGPIVELFRALPRNRLIAVEPGSIHDYYRFLSQLDVGIAPLLDTAYNRCRSDIKFVEYAGHGAVPVVQDLDPYRESVAHGETGFLFETEDELLRILDELRSDRIKRERVRRRARRYVAEYRLEAQHAPERLRFYRSLVRQPSALRLGEVLQSEVPARVGEFERLLYEGLVRLERRGQRRAATALFERAMRLRPSSYLPDLFRGKDTGGAERHLLEALRKNPSSLKARLMLGDLLRDAHRVEEALEQYRRAAESCPDWEEPRRRAEALLARLDLVHDADRLRERLAIA